MRKHTFILPSLLFCLFLTSNVFAQSRKYSNEFLAIGVGARAHGMSGTYAASANDVTSGYWNPAGLTNIKGDVEIGLMHAEYFAGIAKYDYGGFAKKIDSSSTFALSILRFGVDDIPNTTQLIDEQGNIDFDRISSFSATDLAFLISYARASKISGLSYGTNVKVINRKIGDFAKAWGFGIDLGVTYQKNKWRFAAVARDVTSTFNAWSVNLDQSTKDVFTLTGNEIPENSVEVTLPRLILAVSRSFQFSDSWSLLSEIDFDFTTDGKRNVLVSADPISIDPHMGLEIGFKNKIFLRGGVGNIQEVKNITGSSNFTFQPNIGLGLKLNRISLDYALTDIGNQSAALYSNLFSLKLEINKLKKD